MRVRPVAADVRTVEPSRWVSVPTQVEAEQWTRGNRRKVLTWLSESGALYWTSETDELDLRVVTRTQHADLRISTPQGVKPVLPGDWVVRGVVGEFYPVADRVWRLRYRPAGDEGGRQDELEDVDRPFRQAPAGRRRAA